ncbi:hypothetical protein [Streptomyces sp. NPDC058770]|uniref:hypothetical protein n=1 Tax=unclassified Streptomyces TaxID=2593676 RepID=UPI0036A7DD18
MSHPPGWQELSDLTTLSGTSEGGEARMTLASLASSTSDRAGAGIGNLKHSGGPWTNASGIASALRASTEKSRSSLGLGHEGVVSGAAGFASASSLKNVLKSWEERLMAVRDECEYLEGALLKVAKEMGETDIAVGNSLKATQAGREHR